jgi:hypothetical protein
MQRLHTHSDYHDIFCLPNWLKTTLIPALFNLFKKIQQQLGYKYFLIIDRSDNKKGLGHDFADGCRTVGIKVETTAKNTSEQKGLQEAAGRTICNAGELFVYHQNF